MCGIAGIILKKQLNIDARALLVTMTNSMRHRGPDGEGYLICAKGEGNPYSGEFSHHGGALYIPKKNIGEASAEFELGFGHRRLSVIDLSENGHQPMCDESGSLWINYNGEIYNYKELRTELEKKGHRFHSSCDTEVVLASYKEWGYECLHRFNGMWSFCIYDMKKGECFASRDRLGVKPFYYLNNAGMFAFASEQKAFVKAGLIKGEFSENAAHGYLVNDLLEFSRSNFFSGIQELWPGHSLIYDMQSGNHIEKVYFHPQSLVDASNQSLDDKALIKKIRETLEQAVNLRMRSDVDTGVCLSGGVDSSTIALLMSKQGKTPPACFTATFKGYEFDETKYAEVVAKKSGSPHYTVQPDLDGFRRELDELIYALDAPIWDSSTYAQYKVMWLARQHGIKVVLDGQGADELFTGYKHHFIARWKNMLRRGKFLSLIADLSASSKSIPHPLVYFAKETVKARHDVRKKVQEEYLDKDFMNSSDIINPNKFETGVNRQLLHDMSAARLKSFLRCEDRCGMWHSVESRVPFSDDFGLLKLMFSFDGNRKIQQGISKFLLRESMKNELPAEIYSRYDKRGFETPMEDWTKQMMPEMLESIRTAGFSFVREENLVAPRKKNIACNRMIFKLYILSRWKKVFSESRIPTYR
jgi:asparagine synthase (glutamine-hydrolysing)